MEPTPSFLPQKKEGQSTSLETQSAASAASAKADIEASYAVAQYRPRDLALVRTRMLDTCKRTKFAEAALYQKPVGNTKIEGLSIRAAEELIRTLGNIRVSTVTTFEDTDQRKVKVTVTDLEVNSAYTQEITITKTVERSKGVNREVVGTRNNTSGKMVYIVTATDDEMMQKESALVSKVLRNQALRLTPSDLLEEVMDTIKETLASGGTKDPKKQLKDLIDAFNEMGVGPDDLKVYLGHAIDKTTPAEVIRLRSIYTTIKDGESTWSSYVEDVADDGPKRPVVDGDKK